MLLANYKDIWMALTGAVLMFFLLLILDSFLFSWVIFKFKRSRILEEIYGAVPSW